MKHVALLLLGALVSGVLAHPGHGFAPAPAYYDERDLMLPRKAAAAGAGSHHAHNNNTVATDHIPTFKSAVCKCPTPACDPRLNSMSLCSCKQQAKMACYLQSSGGCPKPKERTCT